MGFQGFPRFPKVFPSISKVSQGSFQGFPTLHLLDISYCRALAGPGAGHWPETIPIHSKGSQGFSMVSVISGALEPGVVARFQRFPQGFPIVPPCFFQRCRLCVNATIQLPATWPAFLSRYLHCRQRQGRALWILNQVARGQMVTKLPSEPVSVRSA